MKERILSHLGAGYPWKDQLLVFPTLASTNDHLRQMAKANAPHGTVVIAEQQTCGHGRRGRSFHSPADSGIYLSILLRPHCTPSELMHLTCAAAVAMCNAVEMSAGFRPGIKWTNDLVYEKRKLGGILTELGFTSAGNVDYAIIGIGVNCCQLLVDFPEEIRHIAGSLAMFQDTHIDRSCVAAAMMEALWLMDQELLTGKADLLRRYRQDCITLGREIVLVRGEEKRYGKALDIDKNGALIVQFEDGRTEAVNSGEVSIRGMYGYV